MSLKDWEMKDDGDFLVYNKEKTNTFIKIWKPFLDERRFDVVIIVNKQTVANKKFKRHSQALKYAKVYMKKH